MNLQQSPILAAVVDKQRQQELRNEATQWHAAKAAESANTASKGWPWSQLKDLAASIRSVSVHQWAGAARRMEIRLSAR